MAPEESGDLTGLIEQEAPPPRIVTFKSNFNLRLKAHEVARRSYVHIIGLAVALGLAAWAVVAMAGRGHSNFRGQSEVAQKELIVVHGCDYGVMPVCPASDLFSSPLVHQVITDNLMSAGSGVLNPDDRGFVQAFVDVGLRNVSRRLAVLAPKLASKLEMIQIDKELRDAVVQSLRLTGNPDLQNIGRDVTLAIRSGSSDSQEELREHIEQRLSARRPELQSLRQSLVPKVLSKAWGEGKQWSLTLNDPDLEVLRHFSSRLGLNSTHTREEHYSTPAAKVYASLGGVLEQARALVDAIRLSTRLYGEDLRVPIAAAELISDKDALDSNLLLASCELDQAAFDIGKVALSRRLYCPLLYGSQGVDAMRALGTP